jgi:hypothetical protein
MVKSGGLAVESDEGDGLKVVVGSAEKAGSGKC